MKIVELNIITPEIIQSLNFNKDSVKSTLSRLVKEGRFIRLKRGVYINSSADINLSELSNLIFQWSYISLDTVLYKYWIIKQYNNAIYSISNLSKSESINIGSYNLYNYKNAIKSDIWIIINDNWLRIAEKERALLDSLYLKIFSQNYPLDSELLFKNINRELIDKLLPLYPMRVQNYYLKLYNESRSNISP